MPAELNPTPGSNSTTPSYSTAASLQAITLMESAPSPDEKDGGWALVSSPSNGID
jgi:hypothetical protein